MNDFLRTLRHTPFVVPKDSDKAVSILNRRESVEYGILHIIQGCAMIAFGKRANGVTLPYIMEKSRKYGEKL